MAMHLSVKTTKRCIFVIGLMPLACLAYRGVMYDLGANPSEALLHEFGIWGLRFLLLTLCMTPLRQIFSWSWPIQVRRMLGLFAFSYVCGHFLVYAGLEQLFIVEDIVSDIVQRPFITFGFIAFLLLIPLAVTSTRGMQRRLGRYWKKLHKSIYILVTLAAVHFAWSTKIEETEPLIYLGLLLVLLSYRLFYWQKTR